MQNRLTTTTADGRASAESQAEMHWQQEREMLLEMLAQQQRVAQAGLITSGLAHDIKNHVFVLSGNAELALTSNDPRQWREALERVRERAKEMSEVTNAFLGFVRRQKSNEHDVFRVRDVVEQASRLVNPLAREHRVEVSHSIVGEFFAPGESRLLVQALVNLVSNAIRACGESRGTVSLSASPMLGGRCRIEVSDTGGGIPEDMRRRIFRPFATGHGSDGGTGMGLFIVRQAIRRLGGTIRVRTSPRGTQFQIDLPTP